MRFASHRRPVMGAMALVAMLALAGCAPPPAPLASSSTATDAPVFASDAEALAAATKAYAAYQRLSSLIAQEGGVSPDRMSAVSGGDALAAETESFNDLAAKGLRGVGELAFDSMKLQSADLTTGRVQTYVCLDVSKTNVVDGNGASSVPADRPMRLPLQVILAFVAVEKRLIVESSESWSGANFC